MEKNTTRMNQFVYCNLITKHIVNMHGKTRGANAGNQRYCIFNEYE